MQELLGASSADSELKAGREVGEGPPALWRALVLQEGDSGLSPASLPPWGPASNTWEVSTQRENVPRNSSRLRHEGLWPI